MLFRSEDEIAGFLDQIPNFDEVFERKTPEQVQVMLDEFLLSENDAEDVSSESDRYNSDKPQTSIDKAFSDLL